MEFIDRISKFIPYPRKHRRHYHGVFAPNSPLRKKVAANAKKRPESSAPPVMQETATKVKKTSFSSAKLIARIYEVDPLMCSCGHKMKITAFVMHSADIRRLLSGIGWPCEPQEFAPPYEVVVWDVCHLVPGTEDGFPEAEIEHWNKKGPDPPFLECCIDPPHWEDDYDSPHWCD